MFRYQLFALGLLLANVSSAQVNGYAQVTAIAGNVCSIGSAQEAYATFDAGKHVVIMQMQDNVIGENTFNNSSFGELADIGSAGIYTIRKIQSVGRSAGVLNSITLEEAPGATFNFGSNSLVQAITFEQLGNGGDYTTTSNIGALAWNGTLGGVVAFYVQGTLQLEHNVIADMAGFRGGTRTTSGDAACEPAQYIYDSADPFSNYYGGKGEGIYRSIGTSMAKGRGRIINGGGGGNGNNAGGAGGGNATAGGNGGAGSGCSADPAGGIGGRGLLSVIGGSRVFMGGGGGGGEGNSNASSVGARGGGIILIKADAIRTAGTSSGRLISANGGTANASGADGAGGGGAGGTVVLQVGGYSIASGSPLTIRANGGNGGSVNDAVEHGGGGGGGQGVVLALDAIPVTNTIVQTVAGTGGCNSNASPCASRAGNGAGASGDGILIYGLSPLPMHLISFDAYSRGSTVDVVWTTGTEEASDLFLIERSADGQDWQLVDMVPATGTFIIPTAHSTSDLEPLEGASYYRLRKWQHGGEEYVSPAVAVERMKREGVHLFPNPATDVVKILADVAPGTMISIIDPKGALVRQEQYVASGRSMDVSSLNTGLYNVIMVDDGNVRQQKLMITR